VNLAERFAENLKQARRSAGLSQDDLALRAALHRTEISQLEQGRRLARIDTLVKLAGSLEVGPDQLLAGIDWTPGETQLGQFRDSDG
jgi:transcriptional regulator with XRE-family HTH domain